MTFIEESVISGFIGKVISDCVDISWKKIKEANRNRNNKNQNIESQIYNVIVEVVNQLTNNKYEDNQDKAYQAAEKILLCCKSSKCLTIECAMSGLQLLEVNANDDKYINFKSLLYEELCKNDYEKLYRKIMLFHQGEESSKLSGIEKKVDNLDSGIRAANEKLDSLKRDNGGVPAVSDLGKKFQNDMKQDYIEAWNSKLFLYIDNDKNPLTLSEAFIMPDYNCYTTMKRIGFSDKDKLSDVIEKFTNYNRSSNMLITGVPGIGKTSITAWLANEYADDDNVVILRFRDWEREELEKGLIKSICKTLACKKQDLENMVLILDGFDEIKALDTRESLLSAFIYESLDLKNFKFIITSRPSYINSNGFNNVFELLPFNIKKVKLFYQKVKGSELNLKKINHNNLEVLGIPVILYMAIASGIDITQKATKPELYQRIFAEKGGIFDKFSYEGIGYDEGAQAFRNPENIKKYLKFLHDTAFMMFDNNTFSLPRKSCKVPELEFDKKIVNILEFPIKHLFEKTDGAIEFIHKSIYEYFVADYVAVSMCRGAKLSTKDFAGIFGYLLKQNGLSSEILEFLKYKVETSELNSKFTVIKDTFKLMLQHGTTYYTGKCYENVIDCEMRVFTNMLNIIHLWEWRSLKLNSLITPYLLYNHYLNLNLKNIDLSRSNLSKADLRSADLSGTNLKEADLFGADLRKATLSKADLFRADLSRADLRKATLSGTNLREASLRSTNLREANLREANLSGANLREANLREANLSGANLESAILNEEQIKYLEKKCDLHKVNIWLANTTEFISYAEYHNRTGVCEQKSVNTDLL